MIEGTDVVVVGHRPGAETRRLLEDLDVSTTPPFKVHYFDNTGNPKNLSQAWNDLASAGDCDFIAFLNSDVVVPPCWNEDLVDQLQRRPYVGAVLPAPIGQNVSIAGKRYEGMIGHPPSRDEMASVRRWAHAEFCDQIVGFSKKERAAFFAVMVKRTTFAAFKGFDERLRFYGQDHDFQDRLRLLGLSTVRVLSCPVLHWGSTATKEAAQRGDIDLQAEYIYFGPILKAIRTGHLKRWDELSDAERLKTKSDPSLRIPCRIK